MISVSEVGERNSIVVLNSIIIVKQKILSCFELKKVYFKHYVKNINLNIIS